MGSSAPAPPPDHSAERNAFALTESQKRQQQAGEWNEGVAAFNNQLGTWSQGVQDHAAAAKQIDFGGHGGNYFSSQLKDLYDAKNWLSNLTYDSAKPNWESVVHSAYGPVSVDNPALMNINWSGRDAALDDIRNAIRHVEGLAGDFRGHEQSINQWGSNLLGQTSMLSGNIGGLTIADLPQIQAQQQFLNQMRGEMVGFYNPIMNYTDLDDNWMNRLNPAISQAEQQLQQLMQQRQAEEGRINDFRSGLVNQLGGFSNQIGGLTIADKSQMDAINQGLRGMQFQAAGFDSLLPVDLSKVWQLGMGVQMDLDQLMAKRAAEEQRIKQAERDYLQNAQFLGGQSRMANVFDGNLINALMGEIGSLRDDKAGFSSLLDFNFGRSNSALNSAEAQLQSLMENRGRYLDRFGNQMDTLRDELGGIADYDERGLRDAMNRAMGIQNNLSRFTGNDTMDLNFRAEDKVMAIDQRLRGLMAERDNLMRQAQQMFTQVQEESYLNQDMVTDAKGMARQLREQAQLYNAQQALQQIEQVMKHLMGEKSRLTQDATNVENAQNLAQQQVYNYGSGGFPMTEYISPEQYLQMLAMNTSDQDNQLAPVQTTNFSTSLGL